MTKEELKEKLQPVAKVLFGDTKTMADTMNQRPQVTIRPIGMVVEDLVQIPDADWAPYAFAREPLNGKFNDEQRYDLARQAIACGREYADKVAAEYGTRNVQQLAGKLGMEVDFPEMPQARDRVLFAEFRVPNKIHIYTDGVNKGRDLLRQPGVYEAMGDINISNVLLGHELFHCVEDRYAKEIWTKTYKIDLWGIGGLRNRSRVDVLGEIAAMAFSQALNDLPYSPYVLDSFLVYGYSPEVACDLYEEMMQKAGRTPRVPEAPETTEIAEDATAAE